MTSTSAKTGRAPTYVTALAVAMNEKDGTTTSSPAPTPATTSARCSAVVQFEVATACSASWASANLPSNSADPGPLGDPAGGDDLADGRDLLAAQPRLHDVDPVHDTPVRLRPAAISSRSGCHQATSSRSPCSSIHLGAEAEVLPRGRDVGEPADDAVDGAVRAVLDLQVRAHHAEQRLGQLEQAGLGAAGDVVRRRR